MTEGQAAYLNDSWQGFPQRKSQNTFGLVSHILVRFFWEDGVQKKSKLLKRFSGTKLMTHVNV